MVEDRESGRCETVSPATNSKRKKALLAWAKAHKLPIPLGFSWQPGYIGSPARKLLAEVQRAAKIQITGEFDTRTLNLLFPPHPVDAIRLKIVANANWGVENAGSIHYSQGGARMAAVHHPYELPLWTDCSAFTTLCYSWAGAPDPNGLGYNGFGYTGTMLEHCRHIALKDAQLGDLILWGVHPGHHVAMIVGGAGSPNPFLVSHGSEDDPRHVTLWDEDVDQAGRPFSVLTTL